MARTSKVTTLPGLAKFMADRNMTVVAANLGLNQSSLSLLVNCKRGASLDLALKIADYFDTNVESLVVEPDDSAALTAA